LSSILRAAPGRRHLLGALLCAVLALVAGCSHKNVKNLSAAQLYANANKSMAVRDYRNAIRQYEALTARFPFTAQARQARLNLIYCYYRSNEKDTAVDAADEFLRENPTHPRVDYAQYMKGLIYFERTPYAIERFFGVDMAKRPPTDALKSIAAFNIVVTQYPKSDYAHDARRRLVYLRNRLAQYEVNVARWYVKRGAYLAAAQRAEDVITTYDGAPAEQEALYILGECYHRLGLNDLAANVQRVYAANYTGVPVASGKRWWEFWHLAGGG